MKISFRIAPRCILSVALLAALSAGMAVAPACAWSQEAAPNAPLKSDETSQGQAALPAQPGQVKKEASEEDNVYRHTALVQKLADTFHVDVETMARTFEWINFAIILLAILIPIAKILPKILRKRDQNLAHHLEEARKTTADANTRLSAVEAQLSHLDEEIARIRVQVEEESKQDEARIKASMQEESARIVAQAEQEIAAAAAHAQRSLRHFAADLAVDNAARQLVLTPDADRALIAEFISEATDGMTTNRHAKGARN